MMQQPPEQQPPTWYPPAYSPPGQQPLYPPPLYAPSPPKKARRWPWILLGAGICLASIISICVLCELAIALRQPVRPQVASVQGSVWTTTNTFTGSAQKETPAFALGSNDWKLQWSCNPGSNAFGAFNLIVVAYDASDTSVHKLVINEICQVGNSHGETEVHDDLGGNVYLDISATGSYTLTVQELE